MDNSMMQDMTREEIKDMPLGLTDDDDEKIRKLGSLYSGEDLGASSRDPAPNLPSNDARLNESTR
jgi:hypothetical protein